MSTHTPSTDRPTTACSPALIEFAAQQTIDPRIPAAVPDFDAPFFQAGLAGYSDAAMRLIARRHGSPYCVPSVFIYVNTQRSISRSCSCVYPIYSSFSMRRTTGIATTLTLPHGSSP